MFQYSFLFSSIILIIIDSIYLNLFKGYFSNQVQKVQNTPLKINIISMFICYLFIITGLNYFIIQPNKSVNDAFLLGIVIYGIYETTNLSIFTNWSWITVIIDTLWGGILFALTAWIVKGIKKIKI
jgi:uncharacterized membrane protein